MAAEARELPQLTDANEPPDLVAQYPLVNFSGLVCFKWGSNQQATVDEDLFSRLKAISEQLDTRAISLSRSGENNDIAALTSPLAVTMGAVYSMGAVLNWLNGPQGRGAAGGEA